MPAKAGQPDAALVFARATPDLGKISAQLSVVEGVAGVPGRNDDPFFP
jgi:hypothetical protein